MSKDKEWSKLNDFSHSRLRNEYLFGSRDPHTQIVLEYDAKGAPSPKETTWIPAVFTAIREIIDNALDEIVRHGHGDTLTITFDPATMVCSVADNGRGIPIDFDKTEQQYAATVLMSELKAGRNFGDRGESRGMNGLGGSVVNLCSEYFLLDIHRDKKHFSQRFHEGDLSDIVRDPPVIKPTKLKQTGTRVEFKLSAHVFPQTDLPEKFLRSRVMEIAVCYPKVKVVYNGKQIETSGSVDKTFFPDRKPITVDIDMEGFSSKFWLVPQFFEAGTELSHGMVNGIPVFDGGVHIDAFKSRFFAGLIDALAPHSRKRRLTPNRSDMSDGLLVFNITQMSAPSFNSQNKTRLINNDAKKHVLKAMDDPDFFKRVIRAYPEWIEKIYEKCAERTQKGDTASSADKKKLKKRVEDLSDACAVNRAKCTLFLAEGNSAVSGIVEARNPDIHGALPLRGKILNVTGESIKTILKDEALCKIMNAIGLVPGERANRSTLRYSQVFLTCDADPDGANIFALLINFFFTLWPELFDPNQAPFISVFDTPLIIAKKGKVQKYWYSEDYSSFDADTYKGYQIVRAKGLAALTRDDWDYILQKPKTVAIYDDGQLRETLSLLFDKKRADDRKDWMGMQAQLEKIDEVKQKVADKTSKLPSDFILRSSKEYAIYVATTRAIPRVNDGLKHVQRVAHWLLRGKAEKVKTVALGGEMAKEKLYVHGDVSANSAIGLLAAPYKNNVPLINGHGQFGSRVAPVEGIGAPRYTEVSRSKAAEFLLYPDHGIVPLEANYDGSNVEPEFFAPIIPTVLLNGIAGIAVGYSTSILPRKLSGLVQATQDALGGKTTIRGLEPFFERYGVSVSPLGPNQWEFVGSASITDTSTVTITELPPGLTIEAFRKRLIEMEEAEKITGFNDRSADKISIEVRFKRGSVKMWSPETAIEFFKLREKVTERIVVLNWEGTKIMTYDDPAQLVRDFVEWRLGWYRRRYEDLKRADGVELSYWQVLFMLFEGGFAKKLGTFKTKADMEAEVRAIAAKKKSTIDDAILARVMNLPTYRWTKEFGAEIEGKIDTLNAAILGYETLLADPLKMRGVYMSELDAIKKAKLD